MLVTGPQLVDGATYTVRASGTGRISAGNYGTADAEYARTDSPATRMDTSSLGPTNVGLRLQDVGWSPVPTGPGVDAGNYWGAYQSGHVYERTVTGTGASVVAFFQDVPGYYADNAGALHIEVYG